METFSKLKAKGYVRAFGLSNVFESDKDELVSFGEEFSTFQDEYSLACRKNEASMLAISEGIGLTPMTWGSLGQGILTGKFTSAEDVNFGADDRRSREEYVNFHGEKLLQNLRIVDIIGEISKQNGKTHSAIALRFVLDRIPNSCAIAGAKNVHQLMSNMEALGWHLSDEQMRKLLDVSIKPISSLRNTQKSDGKRLTKMAEGDIISLASSKQQAVAALLSRTQKLNANQQATLTHPGQSCLLICMRKKRTA